MKITTIKKSILYLSLAILLVAFIIEKKEKDNYISLLEKERTINLEKHQLAELIVKKEILFHAKSFNPKKWNLITHDKKKIEGSTIFKDKSLLVFRILPNSCSSCIESELKNIEELVLSQANLRDQILVITSFSTYAEFKSFYDTYKPKNIQMFNQPKVGNEWAKGTAVYFVWKKEQVRNIYVPRLDNKPLNSEYLNNVIPLLFNEVNTKLFIINGKEYLKPKSYINEISPNKIETITTIDSIYGFKKYGNKGKQGVYLITLKEK